MNKYANVLYMMNNLGMLIRIMIKNSNKLFCKISLQIKYKPVSIWGNRSHFKQNTIRYGIHYILILFNR